MADSKQVSVFLFAHQDDECGVYEQIYREQQAGRKVACAYLTTGVPKGMSSSHRDRESLGVLGLLGVLPEATVFAGTQLDISDGDLLNRMEDASDWLEDWLQNVGEVGQVFVPAWEGGHPDHDVLHAITVQLMCDRGEVRRVRQFALYNGFQCPGPWFRILSPLEANGEVEYRAIAWKRRLEFVRHGLRYPSQWRSWIGLFPFFLLHHVLWGWQALQPVSLNRLKEAPHGGRLYYEKRGFALWKTVQQRLGAWVSSRSPQIQ